MRTHRQAMISVNNQHRALHKLVPSRTCPSCQTTFMQNNHHTFALYVSRLIVTGSHSLVVPLFYFALPSAISGVRHCTSGTSPERCRVQP